MNPDFSKSPEGLIPAIIQDTTTNVVLMLGYMNREAFEKTQESGLVTFFSRSKQRLWTKGEESGHVLRVNKMLLDCDSDTLLIRASPAGPVCHTGTDTCFGESNIASGFLLQLEATIRDRKLKPVPDSYTSSLFAKGINKIAQKVGEEAVELVIEAKDNDRDLFKGEAADLLFHYLVLLQAKEVSLNAITEVLRQRG